MLDDFPEAAAASQPIAPKSVAVVSPMWELRAIGLACPLGAKAWAQVILWQCQYLNLPRGPFNICLSGAHWTAYFS
jgi:hypothetical protein